MITSTSLSHPTTIKRIKRQLWLCKLESMSKHKRSTQYVKNKHGNNFLRIDLYPNGELVCYASNGVMKNYASIVIKAIEGGI